jgi:uncharacterized protein
MKAPRLPRRITAGNIGSAAQMQRTNTMIPDLTTHDTYTDDTIAAVLRDHTSVAMIGASANTSRPSYFAMKYLLGKGFRVVPVNPSLGGQEILGQPVFTDLSHVPGPVAIIDIFRNSEAAWEVTRAAIRLKDQLGIKVIWMQLGVRHDQAAQAAEAAGLIVIMNRCPKIEYGRLSGETSWSGLNSGMISSIRPKLSPKGVQNHRLADK